MEQEKMLKLCKIVHYLALLLGLLTIVLPIVFWGALPDTLPMHYNSVGKADNYSGKESLILLFFAVAMLMGVMSIATYCVKSSATSKYAKAEEKSWLHTVYPMIVFMNLALQGMFAYIMFCVVTSRNLGILFLPISMIAVFAPFGFLVYKRNRSSAKLNDVSDNYKMVEEQEEGICYRSKVDWWLGILLGGPLIWMVWLTLEPMFKGEGIDWVMTISTIFVAVIVCPLFVVKYVLYSEHLLVSCGLYGKIRVPYEAISNMKETHNPLSSAALSLDRIQIDYAENGVHQMVLISPVHKREFMSKVKEHRGSEAKNE